MEGGGGANKRITSPQPFVTALEPLGQEAVLEKLQVLELVLDLISVTENIK